MRDGWDTGLETFTDLAAYYNAAAPDARQQSGESDFGVYWYESAQAWSPSWRISCVKNTGEIYAVKLRDDTRKGASGRVVILGSVGPEDDRYSKSHAALEGWENVCGAPESLQWAVDAVRFAVDDAERPFSETVEELQDLIYDRAFKDGLAAYAWWKDGVQYVGTTGTTLAEAEAKAAETWNYQPRLAKPAKAS